MRRTLPFVILALIVGFAGGFGANQLAGAMRLAASASNPAVPGVVVQVKPSGPILLPATASVPSDKLADWGPQPVPIDAPPLSAIRGQEILKGNYGSLKAGIWECSVGKWVRQIKEAEFAYFMEGDVTFTPDGGEPMQIKAGDTVWFPPNTTGVWDIKQKARKTYILIGPSGLAPNAYAMLEKLWK